MAKKKSLMEGVAADLAAEGKIDVNPATPEADPTPDSFAQAADEALVFDQKRDDRLSIESGLSAEITRLSEENSKLVDQMASYLTELDVLRASNASIESLKKKNDTLASENAKLLKRIADLVRENAELKARVGSEFVKTTNSTTQPSSASKPVNYNYQGPASFNGYSSWN